jgi:hypothetical protein
MRLFNRNRLPEAGTGYSGPPAAAMRGRADAIADAGAVPWEVLWEALKTAPAGAGGLAGELGLDFLDDTRGVMIDTCETRMGGIRHGRLVEVRIGATTRLTSNAGVQVTWVRATTPAFALEATDGAVVADDPDVQAITASFAATRAWDEMEMRGGADGIVARRRITMHGQAAGWAYDLWLCERIADSIGVALPHSDLAGEQVPYRLV